MAERSKDGATERLVRLATSAADDREVTIYLKGFLTRGEKPDHFEAWLDAHRMLVDQKSWGRRAYGYSWPSGTFRQVPIPVATAISSAWRLFRRGRAGRRVLALGTVGVLAAEESIQLIAHFVQQYSAAAQAAESRAHLLAARLTGLRQHYEKVRVVAHSLGCRHVIEAVALLDPKNRPDEVHLCAPACRERDVAEKLAGVARDRAYLYHCRSDAVLEVGFRAMARGRALGSVGPAGDYDGVTSVDVGEHFGFLVHLQYKNRFSRFAL